MQVSEFTEDHPFWGTLRQSQIPDTKPETIDIADNRHPYENGTPMEFIDNGPLPNPIGSHACQTDRGRRQKGLNIAGQNREYNREKRFGLADPVVWDAINRSLGQQRRLSSLIIPEDTAVHHPLESDIPSRTPSQRKALNKFTRQLEKYADVAGVASKLPVMTPTESESKVSYHTVQPLVPYQDEFQAAGLAVTSAEQGRMVPMQMHNEFDGQGDIVDNRSCSSSGTFIEFTTDKNLVEELPRSQSKSKKKSTSKGKRGIFPWLRRKKSPATEPRSSRIMSQQAWQARRDNRTQSRPKNNDSQKITGLRHSRTPRVRPSQVPEISPPVLRPRNPIRPPPSFVTPKRPPVAASSSAEIKQSDRKPCSGATIPPRGSGPEAKQPTVQTGLRKRDTSMVRQLRPETIEEEKESLPSYYYLDQSKVQIYPRPNQRDASIHTTIENEHPRGTSSQNTPSTVPSLPYTARYALSRRSSLERALNEVSYQLERMEQEADKTARLCSRPPTLTEKTNQKEQDEEVRRSSQQYAEAALPRRPQPTEEVIFVNRRMPPVKSPRPKQRLKSSPPPPPPPLKHTRAAHILVKRDPIPNPPKEKTLPKTPQMSPAEKVMGDLDVFFNYDDANINDRDVIKGLQVAIHAAADNTYDAWIREKTGLRIRRFLADLKSVGETGQENATGKRA
ncbi:uncharacterized protein GGS25DRAFT_10961 [Hypoxylon fragiforme]|uniref:uncharacterized protein n=1 Tax=Hypoxylon fragiforme TaxID=63214 RepID=UPI0020C6740C|nr:uncharacterized protein GGS25DRAFT_10961 [Hypoxylon fragiforme]KAI2613689.1 hypothetical protein GGS25DRAFT_10961 [Hypoxylon fragiforme]